MHRCSLNRAVQFGSFVARVASAAPARKTATRTVFHHHTIPDITITDYAQRIGRHGPSTPRASRIAPSHPSLRHADAPHAPHLRFMKCSDESLLLATAYILKLHSTEPTVKQDFEISQSTVHRLMIASVTVATKVGVVAPSLPARAVV